MRAGGWACWSWACWARIKEPCDCFNCLPTGWRTCTLSEHCRLPSALQASTSRAPRCTTCTAEAPSGTSRTSPCHPPPLPLGKHHLLLPHMNERISASLPQPSRMSFRLPSLPHTLTFQHTNSTLKRHWQRWAICPRGRLSPHQHHCFQPPPLFVADVLSALRPANLARTMKTKNWLLVAHCPPISHSSVLQPFQLISLQWPMSPPPFLLHRGRAWYTQHVMPRLQPTTAGAFFPNDQQRDGLFPWPAPLHPAKILSIAPLISCDNKSNVALPRTLPCVSAKGYRCKEGEAGRGLPSYKEQAT